MRKCISTHPAALNQNSNSSGNLPNTNTNSTSGDAQMLANNSLLGFAGLTGPNSFLNSTFMNMVNNSSRNSPNAKLDGMLSSLQNAGFLSAANEQLLDSS